MTLPTLYCPPPVRRAPLFIARDHMRRDHAIHLFEQGELHAALNETLAYLMPAAEPPDLARQPLCLVHGSARVRLHLDGTDLHCHAALARLTPDSNTTAALRYLLSRLAATGQLFQPRLHGDVVTLEYRDRLELMHPLKLIELLQRLSNEALEHDDWLVDSFAVEREDREPLTPLAADELDRALALWDTHWQVVEVMLERLRRHRSMALLNALGGYANYQIEYALPIHGELRARLYEASEFYCHEEEHPSQRLATLAECVKEMRQYPRDSLVRDLGHAQYALAPLREGTPAQLAAVLGGHKREQTVSELNASGRAFESALQQLVDYLYLLAEYSWPEPMAASLREALDRADGRAPREAEEILRNHALSLVRQFGQRNDEDHAGADNEEAFQP